MPFRFQRTESVRNAIARIADEQFEQLLADLECNPPEVREARKRIKMLRALMRLVREALSPEEFRAINCLLRDLARRLAAARDADARLTTLDALLSLPGMPDAEHFATIRESLIAEMSTVKRKALSTAAMRRIRQDAAAVRHHIRSMDLEANGWRILRPGLLRSYREGRKRFLSVQAAPSVDGLHEWRKNVKYLWHQSRLLSGLKPKKMRRFIAQLDALGELLGDDHDLAVLRDHLDARYSSGGLREQTLELEESIAARRSHLWEVAQRLGAQFYAEEPRAFIARLDTWWKAWRKKSSKKEEGKLQTVQRDRK